MQSLAGDDARALMAGLESAGLHQERRALRLRPEDVTWRWQGDASLQLGFSLPPGAYATVVLAELGDMNTLEGG